MFLFFAVPHGFPAGPVRLKDEYVYIKVDDDFTVHVTVEFVFKNTEGYSGKLAFPGSDWFRYNNFTATWNGSVLDTEVHHAGNGQHYEINGDSYSSIITFNVPRTEIETSKHVIRYSYNAPYVKFEKDYGLEGYYIEYILRTGALWEGTVSKLHVRVETARNISCTRIKLLGNSLEGICLSDNIWGAEFKGAELERDIRLLILPF